MIRRGELTPGRSGQAYVTDLAALTQALAARQEQLSMDAQRVPSSSPGLSTLATHDALRALVQEAVRLELAPLLARLDRVQSERDHLAEQLRALQAPQEQPQTAQDAPQSQPVASQPMDSAASVAVPHRPWWMFWRA